MMVHCWGLRNVPTGGGETMSGIAVGSIIFAILMVMLVIRVPIGIAMFVTGAGGYLALTGYEFTPLLNILKQVGYAACRTTILLSFRCSC